jgi:hypothetical protein
MKEPIEELWKRMLRIYVLPLALLRLLVQADLIDPVNEEAGFVRLSCDPKTSKTARIVRRYFVVRATFATSYCLLLDGQLYHIHQHTNGAETTDTQDTIRVLRAVVPHVMGRKGTINRMIREDPIRLQIVIDAPIKE